MDDNCIKMVDGNCIKMTGDEYIDDVDEIKLWPWQRPLENVLIKSFEMPPFGSVFSNWLWQAFSVVGHM